MTHLQPHTTVLVLLLLRSSSVLSTNTEELFSFESSRCSFRPTCAARDELLAGVSGFGHPPDIHKQNFALGGGIGAISGTSGGASDHEFHHGPMPRPAEHGTNLRPTPPYRVLPAEVTTRKPCHCDDVCHLYGDCCRDRSMVPSSSPESSMPASITKETLGCSLLNPDVASFERKSVHMVDRCPANAPVSLAERCHKSVSEERYTYLMDVPVVSDSTGMVYSNIFCARCHKDTPIVKYKPSISCNCPMDSVADLKNMKYKIGTRTWIKPIHEFENSTIQHCFANISLVSCVLALDYPGNVGRFCENNLINKCADNWEYITDYAKCNSDNNNYYVIDNHQQVYKNPDCARCNNVPVENIECLPRFPYGGIRVRFGPTFLLSDLFVPNDGCSADEVQDFVFNECAQLSREADDEVSQSKAVQSIVYIILMSLSLIAMLIHMIIYLLLYKQRNLHSKNLFSMVFSLFWAELLLLICSQECSNRVGCYISTVLVYYLFFSAFFWMNVMSYDICKTFRTAKLRDNSSGKYHKYALYAFGLPALIVLTAIIVDLAAPDSPVSPGFADKGFWFANRRGLLLFFVGPAEFLFLANISMLAVSIYDLFKHQKHSKFARANTNIGRKEKGSKVEISSLMKKNETQGIEPGKFEKFHEKVKESISKVMISKERLKLYTKLALIMGLPWFFAFFEHLSIVMEYIFNILNSLQGLLIFISFDCKAKIWIDVCERLGWHNMAQSLAGSSSTQEYSLSSSGYSRKNTMVTTVSLTNTGATNKKSLPIHPTDSNKVTTDV